MESVDFIEDFIIEVIILHKDTNIIEEIIIEKHVQAQVIEHRNRYSKIKAQNHNQEGDDIHHENRQKFADIVPDSVLSP